MTSQEDGEHQYQLIEFLVPNHEEKFKTMKLMPKRIRSKAWLHFDKTDANSAKCKLCQKIIRTCGNTSNLTKHITVHEAAGHIPNSSQKIPVDDLDSSFEMEHLAEDEIMSSPFEIKNRVSISEIKSTQGNGRFRISPPDNKKINKSPKKPTTPSNIRDSMTILKAFKSVYSDGGSRHKEITNYLLYYICTDKRPLKSVEELGFKKLMKNLVPLYKIPNMIDLKKCIDEKYDTLQAVYMLKFAKTPNITLTCDIWSEKERRIFLGVTAHFIEKVNLTSISIAVEELTENYDSECLGEKLIEILSYWNIDISKVVAVVTENTTEIVDAVIERFGKEKHIPCFAYSINVVMENVLKEQVITSILDVVRSIVLWVKKDSEVTYEIKQRQLLSGISREHVKDVAMDITHRWNSIYCMLDRFMELSSILNDVLSNYTDAPKMPTESDMSMIKQLLLLLKPLEYMSKEVSSELYVTISKIIPMMNCITNEYNNLEFENEDIQTLKSNILAELDVRFGQIELCSTIALSTLLDPRFKNIHFHDQDIAASALRGINNDVTIEVNCEVDNANTKYDIWTHHKNYVHNQKVKNTVELVSGTRKEAYDEVTVYLENPVLPLWTNPLAQWEELKSVFPGLYIQAGKYLSIPATSAPAEKLFSKVGPASSQIHYELLGTRASKLLFLGSCKEEEWF